MNEFSLDFDISDVAVNPPPQETKPTRVLLKRIDDTDDYILECDNTSFEKFTTCPRSAEYYLVEHKEIAASKPALVFGSAIHKALEVQLVFGNGPASIQRQNEVIAEYFSKETGPPPDDYRTMDRAIVLMEKYRKKFPSELFELVHNENGEPMVEIKFTVPLGVMDLNCELAYPAGSKTFVNKLHIIWTGKIDALVEQDGWLWVLDHKTTSIVGKQYFLDFALNNAQQGYVWAARQLTHKPVRGSILNALIHRPPTPSGKSIDFQRQQFIYTEDQLDEWHENSLVVISDFINALRRGYFPRHTKWCMGKYGVCPYHDVCILDREQRGMQLHSGQYKNVVWNPLDND